MKTRMRPRYYCDHCGKGSGSPSAMRRHEASCTLNPQRLCRMCLLTTGTRGRLAQSKAALQDERWGNNWKVKMEELRSAADGCPCCMLAALRQTGSVTPAKVDEETPPFPPEMYWDSSLTRGLCLLGFDFKAEVQAMLDQHNQDKQERYE